MISVQSNHFINHKINNNQDIIEPQTIMPEENYEYRGNNGIGSDLDIDNLGIKENYDTCKTIEDYNNSWH